MNIKTKEIYSEVYQVLNLLGKDYIDKLPTKLITILKEKRDIAYNPQYTDEIPLNEQNIKKETMAVIVLLYLNYWCKDESERLEVKNILRSNEYKYQNELKEKYNPDSIFKKTKQDSKKINQNSLNEIPLIPYKKSRLLKIIDRLKRLFHIK